MQSLCVDKDFDGHLYDILAPYKCFSLPPGVLLVMKTLENGCYKPYKFTVLENWRDFFLYYVSALSLHVNTWIESTDSMQTSK